MEIRCETIRARDGHLLPVLHAKDTVIHLGSCYRGDYAAECWVSSYVSKRTENVIFFGMGDCQILNELTERVPGTIVVYEPESLVHKQMKVSALYKKLIKSRKVKFFYGDCHQQLGQTIKELLDDDWVERTMVVAHPGYQGIYEESWNILQKICQQNCDDITFMRAPLKRFMASMIHNQIANLSRMKGGIPLRRLKSVWNPDLPVILVSAGPSLEKNVEELKNVAGRALIFCVDAALQTLLSHDIIPDVMVSVDSAKDMSCFDHVPCQDIPLLASSNTRKEIFERGVGTVIWGYDHALATQIMDRAGIPVPKVPYYLGVSTAVYSSVVELGARVIILVGQDLAFSDTGKTHTSDRDESSLQTERLEAEGYDGGKVWSRMDWMEFKKWFEKMLILYPDHTVINATEGGVRIKGTKQQRLSDVIKQLPDVRNEFTDWLKDEKNQISVKEDGVIREQMHQCVQDLNMIRSWGYHKTFFEKEYKKLPIMNLILSYMMILDDEREERFEKALAFVRDAFRQEGWIDE